MEDMFVVFVLFFIIGFYPNSVLCCNNTELEVNVADEVNITFDLDNIPVDFQINHNGRALFIRKKGKIPIFSNVDKIVEDSDDRFSFMIEKVRKNDVGSYCLVLKNDARCCTNLTVTETDQEIVTKSSQTTPTSKSPVENKNDSETARPSDGGGKGESMQVRPGDGKGGSMPMVPADGNSETKQTSSSDGKSDSKQTGSSDGNNGNTPGVVIMLLAIIIVVISLVFYKKYKSRKTTVEPLNTKTNDRNGIYITYKKQINYLPESARHHSNVEDLIYADLSLSGASDIIHSNIECVEYGQIDFTKVAPVQSVNVQYDTDDSSESE